MGVNLRYSGGGDPLCTLHRAEGLYECMARFATGDI